MSQFDYQVKVSLIDHLTRLAMIAFRKKDTERFDFLTSKIMQAKNELAELMEKPIGWKSPKLDWYKYKFVIDEYRAGNIDREEFCNRWKALQKIQSLYVAQ